MAAIAAKMVPVVQSPSVGNGVAATAAGAAAVKAGSTAGASMVVPLLWAVSSRVNALVGNGIGLVPWAIVNVTADPAGIGCARLICMRFLAKVPQFELLMTVASV